MAETKKFNIKFEGAELAKLKNVQDVMDKYESLTLKVGVLGGNYPDGTPYAEVGALHEFGSITPRTFEYKGQKVTVNGVPTRSWLRVPVNKYFRANEREMLDVIALRLHKEFENGFTGNAFKAIGEDLKGEIIEQFATDGHGKWERNINKKYIDLKGSDTPLRDTGELWRAVNYEIKEG